MWGPLLVQKYGRRAEDVGLVWLWGKIALRTRSRDKTGLGERLGYLKGSFGRGVEAVLGRVRARGGDLRTSRPVKIVKKSAGGFDVAFAGGTETFDLVLSTVAIPELLRLAPDLPDDVRKAWGAIAYCHALCPILELDRSLLAVLLVERRRRLDAVRRRHRAHELHPEGGVRRPARRLHLQLRPSR